MAAAKYPLEATICCDKIPFQMQEYVKKLKKEKDNPNLELEYTSMYKISKTPSDSLSRRFPKTF